MEMAIRERKRSRQLNIRVTPVEMDTIQAAADARGVTVTTLMVDSTLDKIKEEERGFKGTLRKLREGCEP